jgi:hypothetical protein
MLRVLRESNQYVFVPVLEGDVACGGEVSGVMPLEG